MLAVGLFVERDSLLRLSRGGAGVFRGGGFYLLGVQAGRRARHQRLELRVHIRHTLVNGVPQPLRRSIRPTLQPVDNSIYLSSASRTDKELPVPRKQRTRLMDDLCYHGPWKLDVKRGEGLFQDRLGRKRTLRDRLFPEHRARIVTVHDHCPKIKPEVVKKLQSVEILITDTHILKDILYQLPNMKLVQVTSAGKYKRFNLHFVCWVSRCCGFGVENLLPNINKSLPVPTYTIVRASCFGILMGEYVVAGIINFERGLYRYFELQKMKSWDDMISLNFRTLSDLRVSILGAGVIGEEIAKSLVQFGATVNGFARRARNTEQLRRSSFQK
ncbi:hypothetical protein HPB51_021758 [Rhipicephalus microplus]|uniref:D-isomer specific 2-hydroxyacid dehydrogenase NAD-binding domain-containing protein n=1 Tax=Rhipicephalus microplus TaxID=6941 RepID=A0A9J6DQD7_RHIMP|nr:hypothetical protein HPB51_021758 [Rhipicephalus microplus]